jgi:general secretion pathway protein G
MRREEVRRAGFTLIEMLLVVTIVGLLAAIVIPRLLSVGRRARESLLLEDLARLRAAMEHFQADCGACPPALTDIMVSSGDAISANQDGNGLNVDRSAYRGPYLITSDGRLPRDPITLAADWDYDNTTAAVHSSSTLEALDGTLYSSW